MEQKGSLFTGFDVFDRELTHSFDLGLEFTIWRHPAIPPIERQRRLLDACKIARERVAKKVRSLLEFSSPFSPQERRTEVLAGAGPTEKFQRLVHSFDRTSRIRFAIENMKHQVASRLAIGAVSPLFDQDKAPAR